MSNIKEIIISNTGKVIDFCDRHPLVVHTTAICSIALLAINEYANHNAMEHNYNRSLKLGPIEIGVRKNLLNHSTFSNEDGGEPLNK